MILHSSRGVQYQLYTFIFIRNNLQKSANGSYHIMSLPSAALPAIRFNGYKSQPLQHGVAPLYDV